MLIRQEIAYHRITHIVLKQQLNTHYSMTVVKRYQGVHTEPALCNLDYLVNVLFSASHTPSSPASVVPLTAKLNGSMVRRGVKTCSNGRNIRPS